MMSDKTDKDKRLFFGLLAIIVGLLFAIQELNSPIIVGNQAAAPVPKKITNPPDDVDLIQVIDGVDSEYINLDRYYVGDHLKVKWSWDLRLLNYFSLPRVDVYLCLADDPLIDCGEENRIYSGVISSSVTNSGYIMWTASDPEKYTFMVCLSRSVPESRYCSISKSFTISDGTNDLQFLSSYPVFISHPLALFTITYSAFGHQNLRCSATNFNSCEVLNVPEGPITWGANCSTETIDVESQNRSFPVYFDCKKFCPLSVIPSVVVSDGDTNFTYRPISLLQEFLIYMVSEGKMSNICTKYIPGVGYQTFKAQLLANGSRGYYGNYTFNDVKLFQCNYGLPITGFFDDVTLAKACSIIKNNL